MEYYFVPEFGPSVASCVMYLDPTWGLQNSDTMRWYELNCQFQKYGIDPTSTIGMINWAMELYEKGIIDEKDTDGVPMVVGSREATEGMIEKIVKREGFGDLLAGSVDAAVSKIGQNSEYYLIHAKGIPLTHANRFNYRGSAIAAATGNRGDWVGGRNWAPADIEELIDDLPEVESRWYISAFEKALAKYGLDKSSLTWDSYEGKAALMALQRKLISVTDMLLNCKYHSVWLLGAIGIELQAKLLSAGEGRDHSIEELFEAAERIHALERVYNLRGGATKKDDHLPKRFFEEPMSGFYPEDVLDRKKFDQMKEEYYAAMRWDAETGFPAKETLLEVGLADIAEDIEKIRELSEKETKDTLTVDLKEKVAKTGS
jgi:aldehyde:ferredoxin oxidoreductase